MSLKGINDFDFQSAYAQSKASIEELDSKIRRVGRQRNALAVVSVALLIICISLVVRLV